MSVMDQIKKCVAMDNISMAVRNVQTAKLDILARIHGKVENNANARAMNATTKIQLVKSSANHVQLDIRVREAVRALVPLENTL